MTVPQAEHWLARHAGGAIAAQARAIETPACVWAFWLIALVPLVWPQSLDVVQFVSSGVLAKNALDAGAADMKLEEPEYAYFMDRMSKMRWTLVHEIMLGFRDDMTKAEKQDPNSKTT